MHPTRFGLRAAPILLAALASLGGALAQTTPETGTTPAPAAPAEAPATPVVPAAPATDAATPAPAPAAPSDPSAVVTPQVALKTPRFVSADQLDGLEVRGTDEKSVGTVSDVLISTDGRVSGVAIDVGGLLGLGAKKVLIDFEKLTIQTDGSRVYLSAPVSEETMKQAQGIDMNVLLAQ